MGVDKEAVGLSRVHIHMYESYSIFHSFAVLWEKEYLLTYNLLCPFTCVMSCPLVLVHVLNTLKISIWPPSIFASPMLLDDIPLTFGFLIYLPSGPVAFRRSLVTLQHKGTSSSLQERHVSLIPTGHKCSLNAPVWSSNLLTPILPVCSWTNPSMLLQSRILCCILAAFEWIAWTSTCYLVLWCFFNQPDHVR